jgi:hypothetical protein
VDLPQARRKYAEFLERKRVRADVLLPPFPDTADAAARLPDAADAAAAPPSHGGPPSVEAQPAPVAEPALPGESTAGRILAVSRSSIRAVAENLRRASARGVARRRWRWLRSNLFTACRVCPL